VSWLTRQRRKRLAERPIPPEWLPIVEGSVPYYRLLTADERRELLGLTQIFVFEKQFEGVGGLEMTDAVRVAIASQACLLLLNRETDVYPALRSVIVYPEEYVAPVVDHHEDGTVSEGDDVRSGESWGRGAVVLSWDDVVFAASDEADGENIVLHEFAHQLDEETGDSDGLPALPDPTMHADWARVLGHEYETLVASVEGGREVFLDDYAAESPAEFFAVATEFFFEIPVGLRAEHPDLYEQLTLYYRQDPAARVERATGRE